MPVALIDSVLEANNNQESNLLKSEHAATFIGEVKEIPAERLMRSSSNFFAAKAKERSKTYGNLKKLKQ